MRKVFLMILAFCLTTSVGYAVEDNIVNLEYSTHHKMQKPPVISSSGDMNLSKVKTKGVGGFEVQNRSKGYLKYHFAYYSDGSSWILRIGKAPATTTEDGTINFKNSASGYTEYTSKESLNLSQNRKLISNHSFISFNVQDSIYNGYNLVGQSKDDFEEDLVNASVRNYDIYINTANSSGRPSLRFVRVDANKIPNTQRKPFDRDQLIEKLESKNKEISQLKENISDLERKVEKLDSQQKDSEKGKQKGILEIIISFLTSLFPW